MKNGYDIGLINMVAEHVQIPVIACGGAGRWEHFEEAFAKTKVDAVAAANLFHHSDQSVYLAKKYLYEHMHQVRPPELITVKQGE
jgi:cyclase